MNSRAIPDNARLEIKYVAPEIEYHRLLHWVKHDLQGFMIHYPDRIINNIYMESQNYDSFWETLSGFSFRTKIRYRWYGETLSPKEGSLEFKNKDNHYTWKDHFKISKNLFYPNAPWKKFLRDLANSLPYDAKCRLRENPIPILVNRYTRNYFINRDQTIRITLDTGLKVFDQRYNPLPNFSRKAILPHNVILEVKFAEKYRTRVSQVLENIPISLSRHSKYVFGVRGIRDH